MILVCRALIGGGDTNATVTTAGGQVINVKRKVSQVDSVMSNCGEIESRRASSRGLIPKAKVKTVKMTFVIIFVFIVCWGPYIGFDLLQVQLCIINPLTCASLTWFTLDAGVFLNFSIIYLGSNYSFPL